jgi:hypothetical protein
MGVSEVPWESKKYGEYPTVNNKPSEPHSYARSSDEREDSTVDWSSSVESPT